MRNLAKDGIRQFLFLSAIAVGAPTFLGITGCSQLAEKFGRESSKPGVTTVHFSRHAIAASPVLLDTLDGGIVFYAKSATTLKSTAISSTAAFGSLTLPNDSYEFYAVGWPTGGITQNPYCALGAGPGGGAGDPVALGGGEVFVSFLATQANCAGTEFNESAYTFSSLPLPLRVALCSTETDTSAFNDTSVCSGGKQSSLMLAGLGTGNIANTDGTEGHDVLLFTADPYVSGTNELFAISFSNTGNRQKQISGRMTNAPGVSDQLLSPDATQVAYIATQDGANKTLWVTSVNRQTPVKVSAAAGSYQVEGAQWTPDGEGLVYVADEDTAAIKEIYYVNADGTGKRKLNTAITAPKSGVKIASFGPLFEISSDGEWVVYVADQDDNTKDEIFKATLPTVNVPVKLNNAAPSPSTIQKFEISPDATTVVWHGDFDTIAMDEVYKSPLGGAPAETKISPAVSTDVTYFEMHKEHDDPSEGTGKIVMVGDFINANINDIRAMNADGTSSLALSNVLADDPTAVGGDGIDTNSNIRIQFSEDGTKVLYLRKVSADGTSRRRLFSANTSGTANQAEVTSISAGDGIPNIGPTNGGSYHYQFAVGATKVVFVADQDAALATRELWVADVNGANQIKLTNFASGRDVEDFQVGGLNDNQVVYRADRDVDTEIELFHSTLVASPPITQVSPATYDSSFDHLNYHYSPDDNTVLFTTKESAATGESLVVNDLDLGQSFTVGETGPTAPIGRIRVSVVTVDADGDGDLFGFAPVISTGCINAPATDGNQITTNAKIPAGLDAGLVPMAVAIEVFPLATSCSGASIPFVFPFGLARGDLMNQTTGTAKLAGDGLADLVLFLTDP